MSNAFDGGANRCPCDRSYSFVYLFHGHQWYYGSTPSQDVDEHLYLIISGWQSEAGPWSPDPARLVTVIQWAGAVARAEELFSVLETASGHLTTAGTIRVSGAHGVCFCHGARGHRTGRRGQSLPESATVLQSPPPPPRQGFKSVNYTTSRLAATVRGITAGSSLRLRAIPMHLSPPSTSCRWTSSNHSKGE